MFFASKNEDNVVAVVFRVLSLLKVKITRDSVIQYLKPHPDYPSLKSICDLFNEINIENYPLRIDEDELFELEAPFIAHMNEGEGKLILIHKISNGLITYSDSAKGLKHLNKEKFLKTWSRTVILLDPCEKSGDPDYPEKKKEELIKNAIIPLVSLVLFVICATGAVNRNTGSGALPELKFFILLITKSTGLFFSLLLFRNELNIRTKFTDKLCHLSTNTDCNAVTKSKASQVFGSISWADAGIAYFTGGMIILCTFPFTTVLQLFSILSIASLPYPVFSILYQWLKIRKWCPLCVSVQLVLIGEFYLLYSNIGFDTLSLSILFNAFVVFSTILIMVLLIKLLFVALKEKEFNLLRLMKLKRDPVVFQSLILKGERIEIPGNNFSLIFGDENSPAKITAFMSFYCSACAKKYLEFKKLIDGGTRVSIQLVFPASRDELSTKLNNLICILNKSGKRDEIPDLLAEWYNSDPKSRAGLIKRFDIQPGSESTKEMTEYHSSLFQSGRIVKVPSVFINGFPLPVSYELEEVKYFLDFIENMKSETKEVEV